MAGTQRRRLALAALLLVVVASLSHATEEMVPVGSTREFIREMDDRYSQLVVADPAATRGTGFKPYQRYRWFVEPRLDATTGDEIPDARWKAWQEMCRLEGRHGTRSETWFSLGPVNAAGRCLSIEVHPSDPNTAYAGFASSGIWKTADGGTTWTPLGDLLPSLAVACIEIDPGAPNRIWIGTGEGWGNYDAIHGVGVLLSTDGGATWKTTGISSPMSQGCDVHELCYSATTGTLLAATSNGLFRSTDGGVSFNAVVSGGRWLDVKRKKGSDGVVFATVKSWTNNGIYRSTDDGLTFTRLTSGLPSTDIGNSRLALTSANSQRIYFAVACESAGGMMGIYTSTDGGDNWTQVIGATSHYGTQGWYNLTIAVSPLNELDVFSGGVNLFRSVNGGTTFNQIASNVHIDHHAVAWAPNASNHFYVGTDGGVWHSTDAGGTFVDKNTGLVTLQFYAINQADSVPTRALGGTQDNGTYVYNNDLNWAHILGSDGFFTEVDRTNPNNLYGELYYGIHYRSTNGGGTMTAANTGISEPGPWSTPTWMDWANPSIIWTAHNTKVFRTTDKMLNWMDMNIPGSISGGRSIHQCRTHTAVVAVAGPSRVLVTTDNGSTWTDRSGDLVTGGRLSDIYVHPTDPLTMVVTATTYSPSVPSVSKTTDGGITWIACDAGLPDEPANAIEMDPQHPDWYFVGTDLGVYVSFNAGASWMPFNTGLPHVVVSDLRVHNTARLLRAGTHGRGMWEVDISGLTGVPDPAGVSDSHPAVQPLTLRTFGNPASDRILLRYGVRVAGPIRLALFDLQGREVRTILDHFAQAILGSVEIELRDLPAGVYFARLTQGSNNVSQKLVIQH
jgi:photosystem II stability/assembly factor-like uncharacterized protein